MSNVGEPLALDIFLLVKLTDLVRLVGFSLHSLKDKKKHLRVIKEIKMSRKRFLGR